MLELPQDEFDPGTPDFPDRLGLQQNYPNPFNPETTISFYLNNGITGDTEIVIYNLKGQAISKLPILESGVEGNSETGYYLVWDGTSDPCDEFPSGIYFYKLSSGDFTQVKKMILMK